MTHEKTQMLLEEATDILQNLMHLAGEEQKLQILAIFDEMKYSDRLDDEMRLWMENTGSDN